MAMNANDTEFLDQLVSTLNNNVNSSRAIVSKFKKNFWAHMKVFNIFSFFAVTVASVVPVVVGIVAIYSASISSYIGIGGSVIVAITAAVVPYFLKRIRELLHQLEQAQKLMHSINEKVMGFYLAKHHAQDDGKIDRAEAKELTDLSKNILIDCEMIDGDGDTSTESKAVNSIVQIIQKTKEITG